MPGVHGQEGQLSKYDITCNDLKNKMVYNYIVLNNRREQKWSKIMINNESLLFKNGTNYLFQNWTLAKTLIVLMEESATVAIVCVKRDTQDDIAKQVIYIYMTFSVLLPFVIFWRCRTFQV